MPQWRFGFRVPYPSRRPFPVSVCRIVSTEFRLRCRIPRSVGLSSIGPCGLARERAVGRRSSSRITRNCTSRSSAMLTVEGRGNVGDMLPLGDNVPGEAMNRVNDPGPRRLRILYRRSVCAVSRSPLLKINSKFPHPQSLHHISRQSPTRSRGVAHLICRPPW